MKLRPLGRLLGAALLVAAAACVTTTTGPGAGSPPQRAEVTSELTTSARIAALDPLAGRVTLLRADGQQVAVRAGAGAGRLDEFRVGDEVRVHYRQTWAAEKLPAGADLGAPGAPRPGAELSAAFAVRVEIESIDRQHDIVVFALPSGELIAHRLQTRQGRRLVAGLAVGDAVRLEYGESLVVAIERL